MENQVMEAPRERHGFITFWLWLGALMNAIGIIVYSVYAAKLGQVEDLVNNSITKALLETYSNIDVNALFKATKALFIVDIFLCAGNLYANYLMLKWKKIGFYIRILTSLVSVIMTFIVCGTFHSFGMGIGSLVGAILGIAILYAILNIRKNGKSCYGQMQ